jgi:molybdenum cofactor biosynthesis enzyme MoaA
LLINHFNAITPCIFREHGQGTSEEVRGRDFRKELEEREKVATREKSRSHSHSQQESVQYDIHHWIFNIII